MLRSCPVVELFELWSCQNFSSAKFELIGKKVTVLGVHILSAKHVSMMLTATQELPG